VGENHVFHVEVQVEEQHPGVHVQIIVMTLEEDLLVEISVVPAPLVHSDELRRAVVEEDENSLVIASIFQNSSTVLKQS
jgi:hypothetical protein